MDKLIHELEALQDMLESTWLALQAAENQIEELCLELSLARASSSMVEVQTTLAALVQVDDGSFSSSVLDTPVEGVEPLVFVKQELHTKFHYYEERFDFEFSGDSHSLLYVDLESSLFESPSQALKLGMSCCMEIHAIHRP